MTFYYSIKQMLRTPLRSILFFVLVGIAALLLAAGGCLWYQSDRMEREFDKIYTTIATVEQKQEEVRTIPIWDEKLQDYYYINHGVYGERIPDAVLDFEGAPYLTGAKLRPHLGAYVEEMYQGVGRTTVITVEAEVLETRTAAESIPLRITRVLEGAREVGETIWFCDEYAEEPVTLEAGKTYIMQLREQGCVHGELAAQSALDLFQQEYVFTNGIVSSQFTPDGEQMPDPYLEIEGRKGVSYDEVTEGFYETDKGKRWLNIAHTQEYENRTIPVTPVGTTKLLLPFYRGEAVIEKGRDISEKEYKAGADVCLIPRQLAVLLQKEVGDRVKLPLYYADYSYIGGMRMSAPTILNTKGEIYPVFDEREYEIVGIYTVSQSAEKDDSELGMYEVIIPWNTIPEAKWSENITGTGAGYMKSSNTSFQIPNGSIAEYMEMWNKQDIAGLEIKFYDNGYTELREELETRKMTSKIFLVGGLSMALLILLFFANLFISGQQERIVVERLLGRTKRQCAVSILSGMLLLTAAGIFCGSVAGYAAAGMAKQQKETTMKFDTTYSNAVIQAAQKEMQEEIQIRSESEKNISILLTAGSGGALFVMAVLIAAGYMKMTLRKEILQMLGELEEI